MAECSPRSLYEQVDVRLAVSWQILALNGPLSRKERKYKKYTIVSNDFSVYDVTSGSESVTRSSNSEVIVGENLALHLTRPQTHSRKCQS